MRYRSLPGTLEVSFIGYEKKRINVTGREKINVKLLPDKKTALDEVVVIGYGAVKKADLTGSVSNVKMGDIQDAPVLSIDQALQGRIAGADIMSTTVNRVPRLLSVSVVHVQSRPLMNH